MNVCLVIFRESGQRRDFPMQRGTLTIGRKDDCDVRVPLAEVSRHHARISIKGEQVVIADLGSANGTYLNNRKIKEESVLNPGDHVVIGPVVFTVQINGEPGQIRAVKTKLRPVSRSTKADSSHGQIDAVKKGTVLDSDDDPISALEALASSTDQTALDAFDDDDLS